MSLSQTKASVFPNLLTKIIYLVLLSLMFPQRCIAESIQITTYYPAPQGVYNRVSLLAQSSLPASCDIGSFMVEQSSGKIYYCHNVSGSGSWGPISNVWTVSGNYVYPTQTDTNPLIFAGVGTSTPGFKLTLENDGGILALGTFGAGTITSYPINPVDKTAPATSRLIWYPRKAVFRAIADRWGVSDDTQMGNYSVGFGDSPVASATGTVTAGVFNTSSASYATVAGGQDNIASGIFSTITGGQSNHTSFSFNTVSGSQNTSAGNYATISGGSRHSISNGTHSTITGGYFDRILAVSNYTVISGGSENEINSSDYAVIAGGSQNRMIGSFHYCSIAGGMLNLCGGIYGYVGGGRVNAANGAHATVAGGELNAASGAWTVINGGYENQASSNYNVVLGGKNNTASGNSSVVAGGSNNTASGNYSVVAGGDSNSVAGDYSWAGGRYMNLTASADRTFVWGYSDHPMVINASDAFILAPGADSGNPVNPQLSIGEPNPTAILSIRSSGASDFLAVSSNITPGNIFIVKNNGYVGISNNNPQYPLQIGNTAGPQGILTVGGVWTTPSSRNFKDNIKPLTQDKAIETIKKLNPVTYNYKIDKTNNYVGFIAEDVPDLVAEKERKGLTPMPVAAVLTAVLKKQKEDIAQGQAEITILKQELKRIDKGLKGR